MLGSDGKRARQSENGKRARQRERKKSEKRVGEREREGAYLTDSRKSGLKRGRACFVENRSVKQVRKNKTIFFFWFSVDQFEFFVDSHFLTLPNTGKLVKSFTENVLHRNKRSLRLVYGILRPK